MMAAMNDIEKLQQQLAAAQVRLQEEKEKCMHVSVKDIVDQLPSRPCTSVPIRCTGPFSPFRVPATLFETGMGDLPMEVFRRAKVLDFTTYLSGVFQAKGDNIKEKVQSFMTEDKWIYVQSCDLYGLPINPLAKGAKKDLPNVTFFLVAEFIKREIPLVVYDPVHKGTDSTVAILNLTRALHKLQDMHLKVPVPFSNNPEALEFIVYQRGGGNPSEANMQAMTATTGLLRHQVLHVDLCPGKYVQGKCTWGLDCRRDFESSITKILAELMVVTPFVAALGKRSIKKLWFVLDEFSAYAAYTAVAIRAYGLEDVAGILAYRQGLYTAIV